MGAKQRSYFSIGKILVFPMAVAIISSCARNGSDTSPTAVQLPGSDTEFSEPVYSPPYGNLRVSLTDAPLKDVESVFVNVKHFEILISKSDDSDPRRLILGEGLGTIDLLTLRNGVTLPIADVNMPAGIKMKQIRLVLEHEGNFLVKKGGEICDMKTPSAQKTGVKILFKQHVTVEQGQVYSLVVDFDASKSVVQRGNGTCLLKPVLKFAKFSKTDYDNVDDDGEVIDPNEEEDLGDGDEQNDSDNDGYDSDDPDSLPPTIGDPDLDGYQ